VAPTVCWEYANRAAAAKQSQIREFT
jgi:hypothetical protein